MTNYIHCSDLRLDILVATRSNCVLYNRGKVDIVPENSIRSSTSDTPKLFVAIHYNDIKATILKSRHESHTVIPPQ